MTKKAIPNPDRGDKFAAAVKENLEQIMGQRGGKIDPLSSTASTTDIINKINEIIGQLQ